MISTASRLVGGLSITQTIAWASSYYLLAILADAIAGDVGTSTSTVFLALSVAILISGAVGPVAGRLIDRTGGRMVVAGSNLLFAAGLIALSQAHDVIWLFASWVVIGLGMGLGLYEAAFACVTRFFGAASRKPITIVTLVGGFASTIGWPLTTVLETWLGWRGACLAWAGMHMALALPLNLLCVPPLGTASEKETQAPASSGAPIAMFATIMVAVYLCLEWFISTGIAVHLPRLLEIGGLSRNEAVAMGALVGPAQVAARLFEYTILQRLQPASMAMIAAMTHPVGVGLLYAAGSTAAPAFTILHGAGNGMFTIARGTLPLALFGPRNYGYRLNMLMMPARLTQAAAPFLLGLAVDGMAQNALLVTASAGIAATLIVAKLAKGQILRAA